MQNYDQILIDIAFTSLEVGISKMAAKFTERTKEIERKRINGSTENELLILRGVSLHLALMDINQFQAEFTALSNDLKTIYPPRHP